MLAVELNTRDIPAIYSRFAEVVGERHWTKRVELLSSEMRGNEFLRETLLDDNAIAFQLVRLRELYERHGNRSSLAYDDPNVYAAASFALQVLSVIDASDTKTGERLKRRVHGALKNPRDMRGLRLELTGATHFIRAGKTVAWPEMMGRAQPGVGTYDLLVEVGTGLEIECKSFSGQAGRKVTLREAADFYGLVKRHHWPQLLKLRCGMLGVLTVSGELPSDLERRKALASMLVRRVLFCADGEYVEDGAHIRVSEFDPRRVAEIPNGASMRRKRELLDQVSGTRNRQVLLAGTEAGGAFMLVVQSARDDEFLETVFATLSDSAARQFSRQRPALFIAGLEALSAEQLREVALSDRSGAAPSDLWRKMSNFLDSDARSHLVGVCFISAGQLRPGPVSGVVDSGGAAYNFPKTNSSFWSEDFRALFGNDLR